MMRSKFQPALTRTLPVLATLALAACGDSSSEGDSGQDEVGMSEDSGTEDESGSESSTGTGDGDTGTGDGDTSSTDTGGTGSTDTDTGMDAGSTSTDTGSTDTGSTSTDTGSTDTDSGSTDTIDPCQEFASDVAPIPPDVMFLLDRSGSMMEADFDLLDPDKTRWQALYEAVEGVVGNGNDAIISFGAKTFSTKGFGACGVSNTPDVPLMLDNADLLLATIPGPLEVVDGGTPTNLALEKTMAYMQSYETDADKAVILITDGRIGCADDDAQALADAVAVIETALGDHEITTYVVGIAPSIFGPIIDQLNAMAIAGGAPSGNFGQEYYAANDADMLSAALNQVVEDSYGKSCKLNLDEPPFFPEYTKVEIGGMVFELVDDCENQDGFVYTDDTMTQIEMCGAGCEALADTQEAQVQFFCDPG